MPLYGINKGISGVNLLHPNQPNFNDWVDFSYNITTTTTDGWSSFTIVQYMYKKISNLVLLSIGVSGTSNSTSTVLPLPFIYSDINNIPTTSKIAVIANLATAAQGLAEISTIVAGNKSISFYPTVAGATWTASGTKTIFIADFFYFTNE